MSDEKQIENEEPKFIQVELGFLQKILDYLKTRPYTEVHQFVDILTGKNMPAKLPEHTTSANINEVLPEGFDENQSPLTK